MTHFGTGERYSSAIFGMLAGLILMAKKKLQSQKPRTDAKRRAWQCERISRAIRVLQCIAGPRWRDVQALADKLEFSPCTIQRVLQTLALAGVPFNFDNELRAYKVAHGFRFPGLESSGSQSSRQNLQRLHSDAMRMLRDGERFLASLRSFCDLLVR
jgi:hypothetical protein